MYPIKELCPLCLQMIFEGTFITGALEKAANSKDRHTMIVGIYREEDGDVLHVVLQYGESRIRLCKLKEGEDRGCLRNYVKHGGNA